jgi:hypothetical protein
MSSMLLSIVSSTRVKPSESVVFFSSSATLPAMP